MIRRSSILVAAAFAATLATAPAAAAATGLAPARAFAPHQLVVKFRGEPVRTIGLSPDLAVRRAAAALERRADVAYAAPNFIAKGAARPEARELPDDPGPLEGGAGGGWLSLQWNFL